MALRKVYTIMALDSIAGGTLFPLLAPHLFSLGTSNILIGALGSICALIQLVTNPIAGSLSDSIGRKPIFLSTQLLTVFTHVLLAYSSKSIAGIFLARIMNAFTSQSMVLIKTIAGDYASPEEEGSVYGKIGGFGALGFVIGPIIGGFLLSLPNGFFFLCLFLVFLSICSTAVTYTLPNVKPKQQQKSREKLNIFATGYTELTKTITNLKNVKWNIYGDVFLFKLLAESALQIFFASLGIILMESFSLSQEKFGATLALFGIISVIFNIIAGTIKEKFYKSDHSGMIRTYQGFICISGAFLGMLFASSYWVFTFCFIPLFGAKIIMDVTWTEVLVANTKETEKGVVMGAFESIMQFSGLVTPLIGGILLDLFGYRGPSIASVLPVLCGTVIVRNKMKSVKRD